MSELYFVFDLRYEDGGVDRAKSYVEFHRKELRDMSGFVVVRVRPEDVVFMDHDGTVSADNIKNHGKELTWVLNVGL